MLVGVALASVGWWRCLAFGAAGAAAFGLVSVLVRAVGQALVSGTSPLDPTVLLGVAGIGGALAAGGWAIQHAHAAGPAELVLARPHPVAARPSPAAHVGTGSR